MSNQIAVVNNLRYDHCPCCGSFRIKNMGAIANSEPFYSSLSIQLNYRSELWHCQACQSGFIQNAIPQNDSISLYQQGNFDERDKSQPFEVAKTLKVVTELTKILSAFAVPRVLDIGCNTGEFLDFAKAKGGQTAGVEYSTATQQIIEGKGHTYYPSLDCTDLADKQATFDVITAFDLVEHLYDIPAFLTKCYDLLTVGGYLVILTGSIDSWPARIASCRWWYASYPEHIVFPSRRYFTSLANLRLVKWVDTFAAPKYIHPISTIIKPILRRILKKTYNGEPSVLFDHALIFLRK